MNEPEGHPTVEEAGHWKYRFVYDDDECKELLAKGWEPFAVSAYTAKDADGEPVLRFVVHVRIFVWPRA